MAVTALVCVGALFVIVINYAVDPAGIYHESNDSRYQFVRQLVRSENGLLFPADAWNERDIAMALAEYPAEVSCYIIGSSHVMQISSSRQQNSLTKNCPTMMNLGVSGASIEDFVAISGVLLRNINTPVTIVFGIDPWSFNFGRDSRWIRYRDEYIFMLDKIQSSRGISNNEFSMISNLINTCFRKHIFG